MLHRFYACALGLMALAIAACTPNGDIELTLVNQNLALSTEIAGVRSTATFAADERNITAEYIQTAVLQMTQDWQILGATLSASGINPANITPGAPIPTQIPPAQVNPPVGGTPLPTNVDGTGTSGNVIITATVPAEPSLYNIVTSTGVGANDCALDSTTTFSTTDQQIYVVATAANIPAGTALSAQWYQEGTLVVSHDFSPDFDIAQNCIWFYIDQTDTPFTPGNWSVQLAMNGQSIGSPVTFTITG